MEHKTHSKKQSTFHDQLKERIDSYIHNVYDVTQNFPKEEIFGATSQLRRSALSVMLNYIEGYARNSEKSYKYFLDISYGSLKESKYLLYFSFKRSWLDKEGYKALLQTSEEIGKMLWSIRKQL